MINGASSSPKLPSSVPGYRNKTFHKLDNIVDIFFGSYKNTNALYIMSQSRAEQRIRRIRFTGSSNRSPVTNAAVSSDTTASIGQVITFDGSKSCNQPDGDSLTFEWDFGGDIATSISKEKTAEHVYRRPGMFSVEFTVTDTKGQVDKSTFSISVGTQSNTECLSGLVCYNKGGRDKAVQGCNGIDRSLTKWCTIA